MTISLSQNPGEIVHSRERQVFFSRLVDREEKGGT